MFEARQLSSPEVQEAAHRTAEQSGNILGHTDEMDRLLRAAGVATVVTDNPGCVLHLRGVADAAGVDLEVVHPAETLRDLLQQV